MSEPRVVRLPDNLRPGSGAHERWSRARLGMTFGELRAAGVLRRDIWWYAQRGKVVFDPPVPGIGPAKPYTIKQYTRPSGPSTRPRSCLCCGRTFRSAGPHNRLCDPCRGRDVSPFEPN